MRQFDSVVTPPKSYRREATSSIRLDPKPAIPNSHEGCKRLVGLVYLKRTQIGIGYVPSPFRNDARDPIVPL